MRHRTWKPSKRMRGVRTLAACCLLTLTLTVAAHAQSMSPTTGRMLDADPTVPMLVSVSNNRYSATIRGKREEAPGIGAGQPWGMQQADVVYEMLLARSGATRMALLFHDALANGEQVDVGPVRSVRTAQVCLSREWRAGLVHSGTVRGNENGAPGLIGLGTHALGMAETRCQAYADRMTPQKGRKVKAPDHLSVNLTGLHTLLAEERFTGSGLHFGKADPGRPEATHVSLQWGDRWYASSFQWQDGRYHCFHLKLPYKTYLDKTGLEETQLAFENVVVQHVAYDYGAANWLPFLRDVGEGKAELFIAGCVTEGSWRKESPDAPTRFYDAEGCEALLTPGQTYIALLPEESGTVTWK